YGSRPAGGPRFEPVESAGCLLGPFAKGRSTIQTKGRNGRRRSAGMVEPLCRPGRKIGICSSKLKGRGAEGCCHGRLSRARHLARNSHASSEVEPNGSAQGKINTRKPSLAVLAQGSFPGRKAGCSGGIGLAP